MSEFYQAIYEVVRSVPEGMVVTYGQVARLAGKPRAARQVGYALAALPNDHDLPWHRVVNAKGEISKRANFGYEDYQRILLEEEGVEFLIGGKINLAHYRWDI